MFPSCFRLDYSLLFLQPYFLVGFIHILDEESFEVVKDIGFSVVYTSCLNLQRSLFLVLPLRFQIHISFGGTPGYARPT